jgi:hypothetical protein
MSMYEVTSDDYRILLQRANQTYLFVNEINTFLGIMRGLLGVDPKTPVSECMERIKTAISN